MLLFWSCLLLPYLVHPDLVFFEGAANHDNFFWSVGAEHLQKNSYLAGPVGSLSRPLYNVVGAITGLQPAWGRMGAEGLLAVTAGFLNLSPVYVHNFVVCALVLPWLFLVLAISRRLGMCRPNHGLLIVVCFSQPLLAFFVANGNLPNLLGALFGGGLWLIYLLLYLDPKARPLWPELFVGMFCVHGMLCCYPEIVPFALAPMCVVGLRDLIASRRLTISLRHQLCVGLGGILMNPVTAIRAWHGFWESVSTARLDDAWANLFESLRLTEYLPGMVTLAVPAVNNYDVPFGVAVSLAILGTVYLVFRSCLHRWLLFASLTGFFALGAYTMATSFSYGWQKTVQFSAVHLAVLLPAMGAGVLPGLGHLAFTRKWAARLAVSLTLGILVHGTLVTTWENLKGATRKGLTRGQLGFAQNLPEEYAKQTIYVDSSTFRLAFFHGMWSSRVFPDSPLLFTPREKQPAGYLVNFTRAPALPSTGLFYTSSEWAEAFDSEVPPLLSDRQAMLLPCHNHVTAMEGFYPLTGIPEWAKVRFSLALLPYADGWLDLHLQSISSMPASVQLNATVLVEGKTTRVTAARNGPKDYHLRLPLQGGVINTFNAVLDGAAPEESPDKFSLRILKIETGQTTATLSPVSGTIDFSARGNSHLYKKTGFAPPVSDSSTTTYSHPLIQFRPLPAENDIELEIEATPFLLRGVVDKQPTSLRFNGTLVFSAPFTGPGILRTRILREAWNQYPIATIQLHLPNAHLIEQSGVNARPYGLVVRKLTAREVTTPRP